jgi:putative flippase GtrA
MPWYKPNAKSYMLKNVVINTIDFFYAPFAKLMPLQTFRYLACGGFNTMAGLVIYFIGLNFIYKNQIVNLGFYALKPHVAALLTAYIIGFFISFLFSKYIVFATSNLKGRVQLFRFFVVFISNLLLNYLLLKLLVDVFGMHAFFSQLVITIFMAVISYLTQKHFSFKVK